MELISNDKSIGNLFSMIKVLGTYLQLHLTVHDVNHKIVASQECLLFRCWSWKKIFKMINYFLTL